MIKIKIVKRLVLMSACILRPIWSLIKVPRRASTRHQALRTIF